MQILGPFGMYFDAVVVEVKTFSLLFRLALAILWHRMHLHPQIQISNAFPVLPWNIYSFSLKFN